MKKTVLIVLLCLMLLCSGCKQEEAAIVTEETEVAAVHTPNVVEGEWIAGGLVSDGSVYDFSENAALADLYDSSWVSINEDGTFQLQSGIYTYQGTWVEAVLENADHFYVFSQTEAIRFAMEDGELKEVVSENVKTYYGAFLDNDCNVLLIYETLEEDESPLIYLRDGNHSHLSAMINGGNADASQETSKPSSDKKPAAESSQSQSMTSGQRNALASAQNYLALMPFSYSGLVEQLKYEGYTQAEAAYAADHCGADWYEQAVRSAENYLDLMAFSRSGLIEQLEYEGFTHDQAVYGVEMAY